MTWFQNQYSAFSAPASPGQTQGKRRHKKNMSSKDDPTQYNPAKSSASTDSIKDWCEKKDIKADEPLTLIPGVGPKTAQAFAAGGYHTIAQLLGKFLSYIDGEGGTQEVCQGFFGWAKETAKAGGAGSANMHSITFAMANFATEKGLFEYNL